MSATAYPLQWPAGWTRTPPSGRGDSRYSVTQAEARRHLTRNIEQLGGVAIVVSSNVELRQDGLPDTNRVLPEDCGVAVYWTRNNRQEVMACDRWRRPWENVRAIGLAVDSLRAIERSGATQILERAFEAFQLPPGPPPPTWRTVLGFDSFMLPSREYFDRKVREERRAHHPDLNGGDDARFKAGERAIAAAMTELGFR